MLSYKQKNENTGRRPFFQTKLTVGRPGDKFEREADAVANRVMKMGEGETLQMQPEEEEESVQTKIQMQPEEEEEEPVQTKIQMQPEEEEETVQAKIQMSPLSGGQRFTSYNPEEESVAGNQFMTINTKSIGNNVNETAPSGTFVSLLQNSNDTGSPLPPDFNHDMSRKFGYNFQYVRVHNGENATKMNKELNARAFTIGDNMYFNQGQYNPSSTQGKSLLAHELTHVVQQNGRNNARNQNIASKKGNSNTPGIQADFAIEPPNPTNVPRVLTPQEVTDAINYNTAKLRRAPATLISTVRDVLGISPDPPTIDADFVNAVLRWQAANNLTQDGKLGPDTAAPLFRELRAEGLTSESRALANFIRKGRVKTNPVYVGGARLLGPQRFPFTFTAEFDHDPNNGIFASCCEVRQDIKWDATWVSSVAALGITRPHAGFPAAHPADRWIEDRDATDTQRYGHRNGYGGGVAGNRYVNTDGTTLNQANGRVYQGRDTPNGPTGYPGTWTFRVYVVDVCNGNRRISPYSTLTITWI
ncbi:MAG: DUF4157 domain-containing protein [Bacteroidales bacterium]|nr:DUF4157 domain-containing protein [Bacteroidales bacterium]